MEDRLVGGLIVKAEDALKYLRDVFGIRSVERIHILTAVTLLENAQEAAVGECTFDKMLFNAYAEDRKLEKTVTDKDVEYWECHDLEAMTKTHAYREYVALHCGGNFHGTFGEYIDAVTESLARDYNWKAPFRMFIRHNKLFDIIYEGYLNHHLSAKECAAEVADFEAKNSPEEDK